MCLGLAAALVSAPIVSSLFGCGTDEASGAANGSGGFAVGGDSGSGSGQGASPTDAGGGGATGGPVSGGTGGIESPSGGGWTGGAATGGTGGMESPARRDPWLWPFAADSIWNVPIGSSAVYAKVSLRASANVGVDIQHLLKTAAADPEREVRGNDTFGPGRCTGDAVLPFTVRIADDWLVPDAGSSPYGLTPNSNFALLLPDGITLLQGTTLARCAPGGPMYVPSWMQWPNNQGRESVRGDGVSGGGQGASGMSALGGTLRLGELTGKSPIRHAIKINPWGERDLYYSASLPGFKWPARAADSYAKDSYRGLDPNVVMGSRLALDPKLTPETLGIETEPGKRLFAALQDYGVYFTEDAAWDTWDLIIERGAELEFESAWGFSMASEKWRGEVNKLMQSLSAVTNETPTNIAGGGTPRQPLAPPFR